MVLAGLLPSVTALGCAVASISASGGGGGGQIWMKGPM